MGLEQATAIVLDVFDLRERDQIVTLLTAEHGKVRGVARGARAKFSRFAGQLQPLARVSAAWYEKEGRDLVNLSEIQLQRAARALDNDLEGLLLGAYLAEQAKEFAQENDPAPRLFRLIDTTVDALAEGVPADLAARYVEVWVLRLAGIFPPVDSCPWCDRPFGTRAFFVEGEGVLVCAECAGERRGALAAPELDFLRRSARQSLPRLAHRPPSPAVLRRVESLNARIRRGFLQNELRSYLVMHDTLAALPAEDPR